MCMLRVRASCPCCLSLHVLASRDACLSFMSTVHFHAVHMSTLHVHVYATCPRCMFLLDVHDHVLVSGSCFMSMPYFKSCCIFLLHVRATCSCCIFHAACPYCISMLHVLAALPRCMSVLHVQASCQCCFSTFFMFLLYCMFAPHAPVNAAFHCCTSMLNVRAACSC